MGQPIMKKPGRIWFYKPQLWFHWSPFYLGHDEYARKTVVLGWGFTGQMVIAYKDCGDAECETYMLEYIKFLEEEGLEP